MEGDRGQRDRRRRAGVPMRSFAPSRGDAAAARLELNRGGTHLTVRAAEINALCRAVFAGVTPKVAADDGRVAVDYPRLTLGGLLGRPAHRAEIELSPALPWTLAFAGGVEDSAMDLRGLEVTAFDVTGGVGNLRLLLPAPQGDIRVRVEGGASGLTVLRPTAVPVALQIAGGASRLTFDGDRYGAIGGVTRLESHGRDHGAGRYEIEIFGGGTDLNIAEVGDNHPEPESTSGSV